MSRENKTTNTCPSCNGSGKRTCPSCNGMGINLNNLVIFGVNTPCYLCGGSGKVVCFNCHGIGKTD